jgi:hypothetical protein
MFFYSEPSGIVFVPITLLANTSSLYLTDACVGTSSQITFTVSSSGNTTETVYLNDDSNQFSFSPSSFGMTGSVTSQVVTVTFTPTKPWGLKSGNLTLSSSGGNLLTLAMSGNAVAVPLILTSSISSITFANTDVNSTSSQTFTVSAGGFSSVEETVIVSDDSNQFNFSPSSFGLTGSGASQTITVDFAPTSLGVKTANLSLSSSGGSTKTISLQGTCADQYSSSVSLLLKGNGANNSTNIVDSSANNYSITANGNAVISTGSFKYGNSSIYFDGNGDSLTLPSDSSKFNFGTGDLTIESWVRINGATSQSLQAIYVKTGANISNFFLEGLFVNTADKSIQFTTNLTSGIGVVYTLTTAANVFSYNTWFHVAFVKRGTTWTLYINGVSVASATKAHLSTLSTFNNTIGRINNGTSYVYNLNGYIDDFRITKGAARYNSNFTPPTAL